MTSGIRLTGGMWRGRSILSPKGAGIRPTTSLVREAIFNRLGQRLDGDVIDLCAGSGALGFEALSRGARRATFIEHSSPCARAISSSIQLLGATAVAQVHVAEVDRWVAVHRAQIEGASVCFFDPPYRDEELTRAVLALVTEAPPAALVWEHHALVSMSDVVASLDAVASTSRYGTTAVTIAQWR